MTSIFLQSLTIHESWKPFFDKPEIVERLKEIESKVGVTYTPNPIQVLRFAHTDLMAAHVIIYGRDPYPQLTKTGEKVATGRAFEVNGITDWNDKEIKASLRNLLKLLHKTYFHLDTVASIQKVRKDIESDTFNILPPNKVFSYWEQQGVLFLNRSFTCDVGTQESASGSHEKIWSPFFEQLLEYIYQVNPTIKHFLWGTAKDYAPLLEQLGVLESLLYQSYHPSHRIGDTGGFRRDSGFLNNPCFRDTMNEIKWV